MKLKRALSHTRRTIVLPVLILIAACSGHMDNNPAPQLTKAQLLVQSGEWFTTGGTLVKADGTSVVLSPADPFLKTILLYNVTFYADGTAVDTNDPNGLTANGLKWQLSGSNLIVKPNFNNTDRVNAIITYISVDKLVMDATDFYVYNGVTYTELIQTLTH
ncbi:MAG: hypothetical protein ACXVB0_12755 [Mucilaginibacter sp.]